MHNLHFTINVDKLAKDHQANSLAYENPSFMVALNEFRVEVILENIPQDASKELAEYAQALRRTNEAIYNLQRERDNAVNRATIFETRYKDLRAKHLPTSQELEEMVKGMDRGNKINVIKAVRENSLMSIKEALDYVRGVWAKNPIPTPTLCGVASPNDDCYCSLVREHDGDHIAYFGHDLIKKELLAQWPNPQEVKV